MAGDAFEAIMRAADPAMIVVTAAEAGERAGCLVGFHAQSSMDPRRYCVWLSKANHTFRVAERSAYLAIHFLAEQDRDLAERFGTLTGDRADKFAGLEADPGPGGVPVLRRCPNWMTVRRTALLDEGGDHACVVAELVEAHAGGSFRPLRVSQVGHLVPGHDSAERPDPPTQRAQ